VVVGGRLQGRTLHRTLNFSKMNKQEILNDNMDFWRSVKIEIPDGRRRLLLDDIDLAIELGDLKALDELRGYLARADVASNADD
jgi:hypothetical protein